ncbi:hypothetical protein [Microtetraspora malaysiensis]|uniref:Uncharacterized protein n=1 Tax=Microtetraspora malaysiensis TaxID=161358 RepID=A0ABW6SJ20_9ACTN
MIDSEMALVNGLVMRDPVPELAEVVQVHMERLAQSPIAGKRAMESGSPELLLVATVAAEQGDPEAERQLRYDVSGSNP